jgi:hypothetical protein
MFHLAFTQANIITRMHWLRCYYTKKARINKVPADLQET